MSYLRDPTSRAPLGIGDYEGSLPQQSNPPSLDIGGLADWLNSQQSADESWNMFDWAPIYPGPQDRLGEDTEGAGTVGILPNVQEMEVRSWFEANPNATPDEILAVMQANDIDPQTVINAMGLDPVAAMEQYNAAVAAQNPPTEQPPAVEPGGPVTDAVGAVKDIIGQVLDWFEGAPGAVVLNPGTGQVSSVWTYDPSIFGPTQPFIPVGTVPGTQTVGGVTTGNPAIDKVISGILDRVKGGATPAEIPDIIGAVIAQQTGLPSDVVDTVVKGAEDLKNVVEDTTTKLGVDTTKPDDEDEVLPPAIPEVDLGDDYLVGGDRTPVIKGEYGQEEEPPLIPGVPGSPDFNPPPPGSVPVTPPWEEEPAQPPAGPVIPGVADTDLDGVLSLLGQYQTQFPMQRGRTTPADLVDINYFYDVGGDSIFAPTIDGENDEDKNTPVFPFAGGGIVDREDTVEYLLELLRR